jgi:hypothetical protein
MQEYRVFVERGAFKAVGLQLEPGVKVHETLTRKVSVCIQG